MHGNGKLAEESYTLPLLAREIRMRNEMPLIDSGGKTYFADRYDPKSIHMHEVTRVLADEQSAHQHIQIFETAKHGRALVLDGFPQISERDGWLYTEAMVLPALLAHPDPKRVLILGGGDGAAMSFSALDPRVTSITLVDLDIRVVELTQEHIPALWKNLFKSKGTHIRLHYEDALALLKREQTKYDIIISDITDPNEGESAAHLLSDEFFGAIKARLAPGGILAMQSGEYSPDTKTAHEGFLNLVSKNFAHRLTAAVYIPWFSTEWSFTFARDTRRFPDFLDVSLARYLFKNHPQLVSNLRALTSEKLAAIFAAAKTG